jgi:hypothetical protein
MTADQLLQKLREAQNKAIKGIFDEVPEKNYDELVDDVWKPLLQQFADEIREEDARICDKMDAFLMSGDPTKRKFYRMGAQDCAEEIRAKKDLKE